MINTKLILVKFGTNGFWKRNAYRSQFSPETLKTRVGELFIRQQCRREIISQYFLFNEREYSFPRFIKRTRSTEVSCFSTGIAIGAWFEAIVDSRNRTLRHIILVKLTWTTLTCALLVPVARSRKAGLKERHE